jgi:hypothetical protein
MHPLALWLISTSQLRERDGEDRLLRRQREARAHELEVARDGRWAATMRRWADQDAARDAEPAASIAGGATATLGCATA